MRRSELVSIITQEASVSKYQAEEALDAIFDNITCALAKGDECALIGFGRFYTTKRAERTGRNPQTGEPLTIPAKRSAAFKASEKLKKIVKGEQV